MSDRDGLIRQRAYELWEQSDKTQGSTQNSASDVDFWLQAERDIKQGHDETAPTASRESLDPRLD